MGGESSIFKGLGDFFNVSQGSSPSSTGRPTKAFAGQVINICLDKQSPMYAEPRDIGKVMFRDLDYDFNLPEKQIQRYAYPLDRSIARYPMPGEEVMIFKAKGDVGNLKFNRTIGDLYFYTFVVSSMHNVSFNVDPFMNTDAKHVDPNNPLVTEKFAESRFDKRHNDLSLVKQLDGKLKVYKQLQPYEGDFILQGRFGNTIRLGSTSSKIKTPWAKDNSPGLSGDGIMILRVDRDYTTKDTDMFVTEDINKDDSTIYLCTSQKVELQLSCSKQLKSWKARFNIKTSNTAP